MKKITVIALLFMLQILGHSQNKLTIENVQKAYIKSAGAIFENKQVKGYYIFYESDKIDRKTREYTIQILDANSNPVKKTTFQDHKDVNIYDAEFNGNSLCFFLVNTDQKKYVYKIFDMEGKLKYEYEKEYDKGDFMMLAAYMNSDDATGNFLISVHNMGFASILPIRQNGANLFEIGYYSSVNNKSYVQRPEFEERQTGASLLSVVDSTIYLEVGKKKRLLSGEHKTSTYAFNVITQKKVFELDDKFDGQYKVLPTFMKLDEKTGNLLVAATYFEQDDNVVKDYGLGIAFYTINRAGKVLSKEYNPWDGTFSKYFEINDKGKLDKIGYLCIQDIQQATDGKYLVLAEGYKRNFNVGGAVLNILSRNTNNGFSKIVITDLVLLEFSDKCKLTKATIYPKRQFTAIASAMADQASQHLLAMYLKSIGSFDYTFTSTAKDNSSFSFCYTDWEKTDDYKGGTFNTIKYANGAITTDKIKLSSKATVTRIYPAKQGYVGIYEYYRKDKKIEFHLEKLN